MLDWLRKAIRPDAETAAALAAHEASDWARAVALLEPLARRQPGNADILYRLGDALYQLDRIREALPHLERAVALAPDAPAHHYKLGNVLKDLERAGQALDCYRRALALDPRHAQALANTGVILEMRGGNTEAIEHYRRAIAADPALLPAHRNLATLLHRTGRFEEAVDAYRELLEEAPDSAADWGNLGNAYQGLERYDHAARCYERALAIDPASSGVHFRQGIALLHLGRLPEAAAAARRAVESAPEHLESWINLGDVLQAQRRYDEALEAYERALRLKPDMPELLNNMGTACRQKHALERACHYFERAIAAGPDFTHARVNLAAVRLWLGLSADAVAGFRDILRIEPRNEHAARHVLMTLLYGHIDADALFEEHRAFARRFGSGERPPLHEDRRAPAAGRKLRIGYVSSDLHSHPVGYNLLPLIEHHDRGAFEIFLYAHVEQPDHMTRWFSERAAWRPITNLTDEAAARLILQDQVDILVLLAGRFDANRPLIATWRPAPVQVSMHDPATSGLAEMDYLIADRNLVPRDTPERFTERVACLPTFFLHPPLKDAAVPAALPSTANGFITFGSFNNPAKVGAEVVALWARTLHGVPGSRLLVKHMATFSIPGVRARYLELFRSHGIGEERIVIPPEGEENRGQHLARYGQVDIALDPFPFTGSTTTFEALWMGVPVVTLEGSRMVARWSTAMLRKTGLPHLVARDEDEYVRIAQALAADPAGLARLRSSLRERVARSPLCAEEARTRQLERLYRRMWAVHVARGESRVTGHESSAERPSTQRR